MALTTLQIVGLALSLILVVFYFMRRAQEGGFPLPPGPPRHPLIGNFFNFPMSNQQETFTLWSQLFGDVVYSNVLGNHFVTINTAEAVEDILTKKAGNSSNRPNMVMAMELVGMGWATLFKQPGAEHREERKLLHTGLSPAGLKVWANMVDSQANKYVRSLIKGCDRDLATEEQVFPDCLDLRSAHVLIFIHSYGEGVFENHGPELLQMNKEGILIFSKTLANFWLVDLIPLLKYVPDWFPGAGFKRYAAKCNRLEQILQTRPFELTQKLHNEGKAGYSMTAQLLEQGADQKRIAIAVATAFQAGYEATYVSVTVFILAMLLYPDVQTKALEEIDNLTHGERIPTVGDRPNLPYIDAICKEIKRWHTIGPLGVPHVTAEEDSYKGMRIPKGSIIQVNVRLIHHDPRNYTDPYVFRPERFLPERPEDMPLDPSLVAFGFGRRMCPGRFLADMTTYSAIVNILTAYTIKPAPGKLVPSGLDYIDGTVSIPKQYDCLLEPRSDKRLQLFKED
ncbi:cytochrome P450 [Crepidotus variabilis]|uniref:Cytochrome P450 n=1 Tax=Crepidotus variabilis TaxID=179855 RepID=A0A9P6EEW5_9AGAR|nr:cytochrome P450 [Crepidotus variabilis]